MEKGQSFQYMVLQPLDIPIKKKPELQTRPHSLPKNNSK